MPHTTTQQFLADGYAVIPQLADADCLAALRTANDDIISGRVDCGEDDRHLGGLTRQVMFPSQHHCTFADNAAVRKACQIASDLMGWSEASLHFDMLINKTPGNTNSTPWHQDAAYGGRPFAAAHTPIHSRTLQFWLALDPVDPDNGCMHFSKGQSLDRLLPHHVASGDPADEGRLLAIEARIDIEHAVACPLAAGGCTVHLEGALHMITGNKTADRQRRAFIFNMSDRGQGYWDK